MHYPLLSEYRDKVFSSTENSLLTTVATENDLDEGIEDEFGVLYSKDGKRLLKCMNIELVSYDIRPGTQVICDEAFSECETLESVNIPDTVTSIGNGAFECCESLLDVSIPEAVEYIGEVVFSLCGSLKSVKIPDSVKSIGYRAFYGCSSLTDISIPDSVVSIGDGVFSGCSALSLVILGSSSEFLLTDHLLIDKRGRLISSFGFSVEIHIPHSVTSIAYGAFEGRKSLQSIYIPSSVTTICDRAFTDCVSLKKIVIPKSVINIGQGVFMGCTNIRFIELDPSSQFKLITRMLIDKDGRLISCLSSSKNVRIPDSVTSIGDGAFSMCEELQNVMIPNSVRSIGNSAFSFCRSLEHIKIPSSVTSIGAYAFNFCTSLIRIRIPSSVTSIGTNAFNSCTSLIRVTIPSSVTSVGEGAFPETCIISKESNPIIRSILSERSEIKKIRTKITPGSYNKFNFRKFNLLISDCKIQRYEPFLQID